jgi:hypothetical protein
MRILGVGCRTKRVLVLSAKACSSFWTFVRTQMMLQNNNSSHTPVSGRLMCAMWLRMFANVPCGFRRSQLSDIYGSYYLTHVDCRGIVPFPDLQGCTQCLSDARGMLHATYDFLFWHYNICHQQPTCTTIHTHPACSIRLSAQLSCTSALDRETVSDLVLVLSAPCVSLCVPHEARGAPSHC